ncbi:Amidohydrolase 2 [Frankia canadensis]|uniref:Amidohydrolase 2 n=1 Tax=Frankia canadensis TaxID=1836972 RepID=A0A2I2KXV3_9ACTN|nr:amidohydrolase family protein [Frankia canadensis]SNQ50492.1 Amidohydrolase 2 [Frankia canadensis]SOU57782.1 Amidohydrolase 2 [Frankia canadensis]
MAQTNTSSTGGRRFTLVSADTHAGAALRDYRPYLPADLHEEFDAWATAFADGWVDYDVEQTVAHDDGVRIGVSSFLSPYNWDSPKRLEHLEEQGIAAEVIFPNTVPPFYPSGVITAPAPLTADEYRLRWAGVQAHNRWLADFCKDVPGRRAGIAQIFLNDVDAAIEELRRAKDAGLAGVIIPGDHHLRLVNIFGRRLDPFWSACEDLDMPVHRHAQQVAEPETEDSGPGGPAVGTYEVQAFTERTLPQLTIGGVLHRHPRLKFVIVEANAAWVVPALAALDNWYHFTNAEDSPLKIFGGRAIADHDLLPSEYFRRNCYIGSFLTGQDIAARHEIGVDNLMWGSDYPHHEGTWPFTEIALRSNFSGIPEDEARRIAGETAAKVYNLDVDFLRSIGDRIGPLPEHIAQPVTAADIPSNTACPTFLTFAA